jgi:hypothetical protein
VQHAQHSIDILEKSGGVVGVPVGLAQARAACEEMLCYALHMSAMMKASGDV